MNESANIETVRQLYADFGRSDFPALLAALDPAVEWINAGARHGVAQVREFFATLAASIEVQTFEPRKFFAQGIALSCSAAGPVGSRPPGVHPNKGT